MLLEPLRAAESERLMDNLLGESDLPDSVRDYVVETAEGNPLFIEELLAMLVDRTSCSGTRAGGRRLRFPSIPLPSDHPGVDLESHRPPPGRRASRPRARVRRRDEASSTGASSLELAPEELRPRTDALLAELVRKELIRPQPAEERFAFRHQLIRDAAYASMPKQRRAELHERLAGLFERAVPRRADAEELVAYHRDQAVSGTGPASATSIGTHQLA